MIGRASPVGPDAAHTNIAPVREIMPKHYPSVMTDVALCKELYTEFVRLDRVEDKWPDRFQQYESNQEGLSDIEP